MTSADLARAGTWCCELELSGPRRVDSVLPFAGQRRARVLVRLHGEPVGYVTVPTTSDGLDQDSVVRAALQQYGPAIAGHLAAEGLTDDVAAGVPDALGSCPNHVESDALVSVVVCTRNRSEVLADCLARLQALSYAHLEVVVVDNAPSDESTRLLVEGVAAVDPRFRYVREPRPGLSRARNRGLAEARGVYLMYTDDDVAVDRDWVQGLLRGFQRGTGVGCVTGLVCTADISNAAEEYFDARASSWSTRCVPELFDLQDHRRPDALYPYSPGIFGTGASFGFDREFLVGLGGFDEALGAGTKTRGGEDLDIFIRVLRAGRAIAYEPAAVVWHHHRADRDALLQQMFGYGTGLSAVITKCLLQRGTRGEVLRRLPLGLRRMTGIRTQTNERLTDAAAPGARAEGALTRELLGFAAGPVVYAQARRAVRRDPQRAVPEQVAQRA